LPPMRRSLHPNHNRRSPKPKTTLSTRQTLLPTHKRLRRQLPTAAHKQVLTAAHRRLPTTLHQRPPAAALKRLLTPRPLPKATYQPILRTPKQGPPPRPLTTLLLKK